MRDKNRIPEILKELEKVWLEHPDFRLGQLITIATKPENPHPSTFYIEDDKILDNLKSFGKYKSHETSKAPYWDKYPDIIRMELEELNTEVILNMLNTIQDENKDIIITPVTLMELVGAPVDDSSWMKKQEQRILKLTNILEELEHNGALTIAQVGYKIKK